MMRRLAVVSACVALLTACGEPAEEQAWAPVYPAFEARPVLQDKLAAVADLRLPRVGADQLREIRDLIEASQAGGRLAHSANGQLEQLDPHERTDAMLQIVEDLKAEVGERRAAYMWLRDHGTPGLVPRMTLRLKYEQDLWSAVCVADTLLRHGNGAGLDALAAVLEREPRDAAEESARSYAATLLPALAPREGWEPGADFASDWQRLSEVRQLWTERRLLAEDEEQPADFPPEIDAEIAVMCTRLLSMPLRPVDDARFVLVRQRGAVVPWLCELSLDDNRYLREHALQTLSWMGPPVRPWTVARDFDYVGTISARLGEGSLRARALVALGAGRSADATEDLAYWLVHGTREQSAAAADGLLRCADDTVLSRLESWLSPDGLTRLSPEAAFSLYLLWQTLAPDQAAETPAEILDALPAGEQERRRRWAAERALP